MFAVVSMLTPYQTDAFKGLANKDLASVQDSSNDGVSNIALAAIALTAVLWVAYFNQFNRSVKHMTQTKTEGCCSHAGTDECVTVKNENLNRQLMAAALLSSVASYFLYKFT